MAIAVTPGPSRDDEGRLATGTAIALGIVIGLFIYGMLDAYVF